VLGCPPVRFMTSCVGFRLPQYRILKSGDTAGTPPGPADAVVCHYRGASWVDGLCVCARARARVCVLLLSVFHPDHPDHASIMLTA